MTIYDYSATPTAFRDDPVVRLRPVNWTGCTMRRTWRCGTV